LNGFEGEYLVIGRVVFIVRFTYNIDKKKCKKFGVKFFDLSNDKSVSGMLVSFYTQNGLEKT
jgi:hypothetical protein